MTTTVRHLASRVGADERTLRRAVEQGAIRCLRVSPRRIEVTEHELRYLREHWPLVERLRAALRTEPNVRLAALFGSLARGDADRDADIDVLVELTDDGWARRQRLATRLEQGLGRPVDLVEVRRAARENPGLVLDVLREGRVLVDRERGWPALAERERELRRAAQRRERYEAEAARLALEDLGAT